MTIEDLRKSPLHKFLLSWRELQQMIKASTFIYSEKLFLRRKKQFPSNENEKIWPYKNIEISSIIAVFVNTIRMALMDYGAKINTQSTKHTGTGLPVRKIHLSCTISVSFIALNMSLGYNPPRQFSGRAQSFKCAFFHFDIWGGGKKFKLKRNMSMD